MVIKAKFLLVLIIIISLTSCASLYSSKSHYEDIDYQLESGNQGEALVLLQESKEDNYKAKDRVLYYLEEGMLYRYAGQYEQSNESLTSAEYAIQELLTKSISKGVLSGVLNDNALDYSGEDYEDIYINIFKALNYLQLNEQEEALIEIRKSNDKLNNLENKYRDQLNDINTDDDVEIPEAEFNFYNDAMARYLGVLAYRAEGSYDDSRIERDYLNRAYELQTQIYDFTKPTIPVLESENALVNIFSYSGFCPEKVADTIVASTGPNGIFLGASSDSDYSDSSYLGFSSIAASGLGDGISLKLQFPRLVNLDDRVNSVDVLINGSYYGTLELIESINNVAQEVFKVKQPLIVGKTVVRAVTKAVVAEASQQVVADQFGSGYGLLAGLAGDVYMEVSENSDLRISRYFPGKIRGLELALDPGVYDFTLIYHNKSKRVIYQEEFKGQNVSLNKLNLIESHYISKD